MASDYGLNFGFRRSDETMRVAEGRFRTPAGSSLVMGTCVEVDPAEPGYMRQGAANAAPRTGICGLLLQELDWDFSIYETSIVDSYDKGVARPGRLSVITNGSGVKVWFRNTAQINRADGRVIPARTLVDFTGGIDLGDQLGWNGTAWAVVDGATVTEAHMEVVDVDNDGEYLEATLLK